MPSQGSWSQHESITQRNWGNNPVPLAFPTETTMAMVSKRVSAQHCPVFHVFPQASALAGGAKRGFGGVTRTSYAAVV